MDSQLSSQPSNGSNWLPNAAAAAAGVGAIGIGAVALHASRSSSNTEPSAAEPKLNATVLPSDTIGSSKPPASEPSETKAKQPTHTPDIKPPAALLITPPAVPVPVPVPAVHPNPESFDRDWFAGDKSMHVQLRNLRDQPAESLSQIVLDAAGQPELGRGKDAHVHHIPGRDGLVLRVASDIDILPALRSGDARLKVVPVRYGGQMSGLANEDRLGIPRAILVPEGHALGDRHSVTAREALDTKTRVPLWILNRCDGQRAPAGCNKENYDVKVSPMAADAERELQAARTAPNRDEAELRTKRRKAYTIKNSRPVEQHTRIADVFQNRANQAHYSDSPRALAQHLTEAKKLLDDTTHGRATVTDWNDRPEPAIKRSQATFVHTYNRFVERYQERIAQIADLPQSAFDEAVGALKTVQDSDKTVRLDFNHCGNTLIDREHGRISFVDLDFEGKGNKASLEAFSSILLGRENRDAWKQIVRDEDREALRPSIQQVFDKVDTAATRHNVAWKPTTDNADQIPQMRRFYNIR